MENGSRPYAIPIEPDSGAIILSGTRAPLRKIGDGLTIMSFALLDDTEAIDWKPNVIVLEEKNIIISTC